MKKVLVVDDAAFMRMAIKTYLTKNGFNEFEEAENGLEAIQKYRDFKPDIVTLDITMPEMSGLQALKEIIEFDSKAKVIIISALGQEDLVREAIMLGARSFIVKPFNEDQLVKTVSKVLGV